MAAFDARVTTLTQELFLPKVVDNVLNSNVLAYRLLGNAKEGKGESVNKAIKYQSSGTATSFWGLDTFTATPLSTKVEMYYDMRAIRIPVAIAGVDEVANKAKATQVTDIVKVSLEESEQELADYLGTALYGDGTGNKSKDPLGLGAIVDDSTDVSTIGGLSRSTYTVLKATRTASGGTLTLAKMATLFSAISSGSDKSSPTLMVSNETVWDLYEQLLTPVVRQNYSDFGYYKVGRTTAKREGLVGTQGFTALTYKGIPFARDEKATAQNLFMLNENWLDWYGWSGSGTSSNYKDVSVSSETVEGLYAEPPMSETMGFAWSGFRAPTNQFGSIADVILLGNLMSFQPRRHGRLTGITGV